MLGYTVYYVLGVVGVPTSSGDTDACLLAFDTHL